MNSESRAMFMIVQEVCVSEPSFGGAWIDRESGVVWVSIVEGHGFENACEVVRSAAMSRSSSIASLEFVRVEHSLGDLRALRNALRLEWSKDRMLRDLLVRSGIKISRNAVVLALLPEAPRELITRLESKYGPAGLVIETATARPSPQPRVRRKPIGGAQGEAGTSSES